MSKKKLYKAAVVGASLFAASAILAPAAGAQETQFPVNIGDIVSVSYADHYNQFCVTTHSGGSATVHLAPKTPGNGPIEHYTVAPFSTGCVRLTGAVENELYTWHVDGYYWADGSGTFRT